MKLLSRIVMSGLLLGVARPSHAELILTMEQVDDCSAGPCHHDVLVSGGGTVNLADLIGFDLSRPEVFDAEIMPFFAKILLGSDPSHALPIDVYGSPLVHGPSDFGPDYVNGHFFTLASSGTGDRFGILGDGNFIVVPDGYVSGDPLSATSVYAGQTLKSLGVTPGTYVWTWGAGVNADSFTLEIKPAPAPVPEPVSLSLLGVAAAGLGVRRWRRTVVGAQRK